MTKSDLEFLDEALRTYRFMMASATSGKFGTNKDISKYMSEAARVQDRLSQELKGIVTVVETIAPDSESMIKAGEEFSKNWASYRSAQRSMLGSVLTYLECAGQHGLANRIKEKFGGDCKD